MPHHVMSHHFSPLKNNSKNSNKIYYNPLRVINLSTYSHAASPHVTATFSFTNNSEKT
jgi:hypothetical protein